MQFTVYYVTELYVYISVQALVDLCCVTVTKFVGNNNDFRLPTDIRQALQRYVFITIVEFAACRCVLSFVRQWCLSYLMVFTATIILCYQLEIRNFLR